MIMLFILIACGLLLAIFMLSSFMKALVEVIQFVCVAIAAVIILVRKWPAMALFLATVGGSAVLIFWRF